MSHVILDLDQTLIYSEPTDEFDIEKHRAKALKFANYDMDGHYIVFERPGLQSFLEFLFKNFDVSVWTAASKSYAIFVVEKVIKPSKTRPLRYVLFDKHCDYTEEEGYGYKGLPALWKLFKLSDCTPENTIIIDDNNEVKTANGKMCIAATPFKFQNNNSPNDKFLEKARKKLEAWKSRK